MNNTKKILFAIVYIGLISTSSAQAETVEYIHTDILGSPIAATDSSGRLVWREHYTPYGEKMGNSDSSKELGYTGHHYDQETGLTYMQARYYDPFIGRFYSNDPIDTLGHIKRGNSSHGFNRYAYANNNPYRYTDPDGKFSRIIIMIAERHEKEIREEHWSRNKNNKAPQTETEAKESELEFEQLPENMSIFHMQGIGGESNKKYVSKDGKHEGVYDGDGNLVKDDVNQGTYNFASPTDSPIQHGIVDVVPYILYGNTPNDPTTMVERITASYEGDVNAKKN